MSLTCELEEALFWLSFSGEGTYVCVDFVLKLLSVCVFEDVSGSMGSSW